MYRRKGIASRRPIHESKRTVQERGDEKISSKDNRILALENEKEALIQQLRQLQNEMKKSRSMDVKNLEQSTMRHLQVINQGLEKKLKQRDEELSKVTQTLNEKIKSLQSVVSELKKKEQEWLESNVNKNIIKLNNLVKTLKDEKKNVEKSLSIQTRRVSEKDNRLNSEKQHSKELSVLNTNLREQLSNLQDKVQKLEKDNKDLVTKMITTKT